MANLTESQKLLKELNSNWTNMNFNKEVHSRTGCNLLRASEDMIELLEENQVQLQNMMTSKYIGYFYEEISDHSPILIKELRIPCALICGLLIHGHSIL